jgi:hypothetical protein
MKNSINNSASNAVQKILEAFENGNIPKAIAYSTFNPPSNIPAYKWTPKNRALAFLQGTGDARGFNQWKEAGRYVKKGAKSIYILGPVLKKTNQHIEIENKETGEVSEIDNLQCVGYFGIPVFRMEDTDGEPLQYVNLDPEKLPLADVAKKWGLEVIAGSFNGEYFGYYSPNRKEIVMATNEEKTFLHELSHAAHFRIDPKAADLPKWQLEVVAELSAGALLYMLGKEAQIGNHFRYIKNHAADANLDPLKACMKILDICLAVIEAITAETKALELVEVVA